MTAFYSAWAELDELDESLGIDPVSYPRGCDGVNGHQPMFTSYYCRKNPCTYCKMVEAHGRPPGASAVVVMSR